MITFQTSGSFDRTERFLKRISSGEFYRAMSKYGEIGKNALASSTPRDSGLAASSWAYSVEIGSGSAAIYWYNTDVENGFKVAIMIQYGHGTGTGGYVQGRDYINPAMRPVFDQIAENVWKEVTRA